jgi:isocitrate lyase
MRTFAQEVEEIQREWDTNPRWDGVRRDYTAEDVVALRGSIRFDLPVARHGAELLWRLVNNEHYVHTFGALTGGQAVQMVRAGLKAIYVSGWQVAGDANLAYQTYPDQSLYPKNSVPTLVRRINNALLRADQVEWAEHHERLHDWMVPIVADAEAGFGGSVHAFELMKAMIEAGAAGVHFEDQLAAAKKCGHLGGKVLVPTAQFVNTLRAARLASDVLGVPTVLVARTDALSARGLTSDIDEADREFLTGERTPEGYHVLRGDVRGEIIRGLAYAPYADILWFESSHPDLEEARQFAEAIHHAYPGKLFAYNCSPSFNWKRYLDDATIATFQRELAAMGFKFQFVTLAGWHLLNYHTYQLAKAYAQRGMSAYVELQQAEFEAAHDGYTAIRHQQEVGTGYFDRVQEAITRGQTSTLALDGSTEAEQFGWEGPERDVKGEALG